MARIPTFERQVGFPTGNIGPILSPAQAAQQAGSFGQVGEAMTQVATVLGEMEQRKAAARKSMELNQLNLDLMQKHNTLRRDLEKINPFEANGQYADAMDNLHTDYEKNIQDPEVKQAFLLDFEKARIIGEQDIYNDTDRRQIESFRADLETSYPQYVNNRMASTSDAALQDVDEKFQRQLTSMVDLGVMSDGDANKMFAKYKSDSVEAGINNQLNPLTPTSVLVSIIKGLSDLNQFVDVEPGRRGTMLRMAVEALDSKNRAQEKAVFDQTMIDTVQRAVESGPSSGVFLSPDGKTLIGDKEVSNQSMVDRFYELRVLPVTDDNARANVVQRLIRNTNIIPSQMKYSIQGRIVSGSSKDKAEAAMQLLAIKQASPVAASAAFTGPEGESALRMASYMEWANLSGNAPDKVVEMLSHQPKEVIDTREKMAFGKEFTGMARQQLSVAFDLGLGPKAEAENAPTAFNITQTGIPEGMLSEFLSEARATYVLGGSSDASINYALDKVKGRWANTSVGALNSKQRWMEYAPDTMPEYNRGGLTYKETELDKIFREDQKENAALLGIPTSNFYIETDILTPSNKTWAVFYENKEGIRLPLYGNNGVITRWYPAKEQLDKAQINEAKTMEDIKKIMAKGSKVLP